MISKWGSVIAEMISGYGKSMLEKWVQGVGRPDHPTIISQMILRGGPVQPPECWGDLFTFSEQSSMGKFEVAVNIFPEGSQRVKWNLIYTSNFVVIAHLLFLSLDSPSLFWSFCYLLFTSLKFWKPILACADQPDHNTDRHPDAGRPV